MAFSRRAGINILALLRVIGWLLLIESLFLIIPLTTALYYHEADWEAFAITVAITFSAGLGMTFIRPRSAQMGRREGFLLTGLVWIVFSIFGMLPMLLMEHPISVSSAFFEAMSGFTTTGSSIFPSITHLSHGVIIWRSVMQWIGGMGIILFTLAVIPMLNNTGGMQMFNAEVTGITHDKLRPRVSQTAKGLWTTYIILTGLLFGLLIIGPMKPFDACCHALSVMSTGGFSTSDAAIGAWQSDYILIVLTVFMFLGGVNFSLIFRGAHGDFRSVWANDIFRFYLRVILFFYIVFVIGIFAAGQAVSVKSVTLEPLFMIVSTISSTGYVIDSFPKWGTFLLTLVFIMMFFGACAGSTSGGAKLDRMLFLLQNCRNEIYRCLHPNNIFTVRINGKVAPQQLVTKVIAFLCLYVLVIIAGGILLCAMGVPLVDSFFSAFSCISNTGIAAGITGYGGNYEIIPELGKWLLAMIMLIGRLEVFTILIIFTPVFWKK